MSDRMAAAERRAQELGIDFDAEARAHLQTTLVLDDVRTERDRQEQIGDEKRAAGKDWRSCADPDMAGGDPMRYLVLGEEFGEVANAMLEGTDDAHLREELVQVAAVAVAWAEAIDRRNES